MNEDREAILSRVRGALAPPHRRAPLPDYDPEIAVLRQVLAGRDLAELFAERLKRVGGLAFTDPAALAAHLRAGGRRQGYCDPALWPALAAFLVDGFTVEQTFDRKRVDDYTFGITRAAGEIAESGSIILNDAISSSRLAALAPWVHVAVLRREDIHCDISQAVTALGDDPNVIWCTGPSKTADVEGILIEGVHGPGEQLALIV